jgi:hypothetical protein
MSGSQIYISISIILMCAVVLFPDRTFKPGKEVDGRRAYRCLDPGIDGLEQRLSDVPDMMQNGKMIAAVNAMIRRWEPSAIEHHPYTDDIGYSDSVLQASEPLPPLTNGKANVKEVTLFDSRSNGLVQAL